MPKQKYILLVPTHYNDGSEVAAEVLTDIQMKIWTLAGGYTITGTVHGAYKMADGTKKDDTSIQYWIVIDQDQKQALVDLVKEIGTTLGQETMFLEESGSVDFV